MQNLFKIIVLANYVRSVTEEYIPIFVSLSARAIL